MSAGHSDAYYERAQEVRTEIRCFSVSSTACFAQVQRMVEAELACKLQEYDAFILPAAPSPAYLKSEKVRFLS